MLYDVEQVASKLNVSKMTVYNKIKLKEFKSQVIKKQGKTFIDEDLFKLIQESIKLKSEIESDTVENEASQETAIDTEDLLNLNKDLISALLEQLKEKDKQIEQLHKLIENNQVLLKNEQEKPKQDTLLLEEHFKELDIKLIDMRQQMEQRKQEYEAKSKKSLFEKLFNKD